MNSDAWGRIGPLLDELLERPPEARAERREALTAGDPQLRAAVEPFLGDDLSGPLDASLDTFVAAVLDEDAKPVPEGRQIGPYRVLRGLGRGGMGSVVLAEREGGGFEQRVALKLVRGDRPDIVERFRHERQILAGLRHPNIATLHDGGATESGEPWFALEYVDGERITTWCDERRLDVDARVGLFEDVCRAVQYAHRNLVIHRDLKPGNVLVTEDGTVKLLDFGIATILDPGQAGDSTETSGFMTPAYCAPEQVLGEATSTATDIYSLGVLLYELLTGANPHGDTSRSVELARAVVEEEPPSASTSVAAGRAAARGVDPGTLRRRLRGDLDNILGKALRKRPEERYSSAEELRADLERYRRQLPVSARPATLRYRVAKFARRHRIGSVAIVAVVVSLVAGVGGIVWQARVAAQERDRARAEAARAGAVKDFLLGVFAAADPAAESGEAVTAVELARRGADDLDRRFRDDPEVRAEVTGTLGSVFLNLGEYDRADTLLSRAAAEYRALGRDDDAIGALNELGAVYQWQERFDEAEVVLTEAIELGEGRLPPDHPLMTNALETLGVVRFGQGRYQEAEEVVRESLERVRNADGDRREDQVTYIITLGSVLHSQGRLAEAVEVIEEGLAIQRELVSEGDLRTGQLLVSLGDMVDDLDRSEEAEVYLREGLEILRREYGEAGHPEIAMALSNLAGCVRRQGRMEEAEALGRETIEIFREQLGDEHAFVARAYNNLAVTLDMAGDKGGAARSYEECLRIARISFGPRHPAILPFLSNYAGTLADLGRYDEAEVLYAEAMSIGEESGTNLFGSTYAILGQANVLRRTGRLAESEVLTRQAWEIRKDTVGPGHSAELHARITLASLLMDRGQPGDARPLLDSALEDSRAGLPDTRGRLRQALEERARLAREEREPVEERSALLAELLEIRREALAADDPEIRRLEDELAQLAGS